MLTHHACCWYWIHGICLNLFVQLIWNVVIAQIQRRLMINACVTSEIHTISPSLCSVLLKIDPVFLKQNYFSASKHPIFVHRFSHHIHYAQQDQWKNNCLRYLPFKGRFCPQIWNTSRGGEGDFRSKTFPCRFYADNFRKKAMIFWEGGEFNAPFLRGGVLRCVGWSDSGPPSKEWFQMSLNFRL